MFYGCCINATFTMFPSYCLYSTNSAFILRSFNLMPTSFAQELEISMGCIRKIVWMSKLKYGSRFRVRTKSRMFRFIFISSKRILICPLESFFNSSGNTAGLSVTATNVSFDSSTLNTRLSIARTVSPLMSLGKSLVPRKNTYL